MLVNKQMQAQTCIMVLVLYAGCIDFTYFATVLDTNHSIISGTILQPLLLIILGICNWLVYTEHHLKCTLSLLCIEVAAQSLEPVRLCFDGIYN